MTAWTGTQDADAYVGSPDADTLEGAGGNDTLVGNGGIDQITGGEGEDRLEGAGTLDGGVGADTITSYGGVAYGGAEGDHITLEYGAGDVWGDAGDDVVTLDSYSTAGIVNGGEGFDTLEIVSSGVISHFLSSTAGFEALNAASGLFYGGSDTVVGDTLDFGGLTVTSAHGVIMDLRAGDDSFAGSDANDAVYGGAGRDQIDGGLGNDTLDGGDDADVLQGGAGHDALTGGAGADTFRFDVSASADADQVFDFSSAEGDKIALSRTAFGITSLDGVLVDDHPGGAVAHNGGYFISYDTTGHDLYLFTDDAHGDQRLFLAHLDGVDSLSASDFALF